MGEPAAVPAAPVATPAPGVVEPTPAPAAPPATDPAPAPAPVVDHAAEAEKWKAIARQNEARAKANADAAKASDQQRELLAKVAAQLGLTEPTPDPAAITAKLEAAERSSKAAARELAVLRAAARVGANGDELLDSRQFLAGIDKLDPADAEGLTAAIKAAVAANPAKYGVQGAASAAQGTQQGGQQHASTAASGGQFNGAAGGQRQWTKADVDSATPADVAKAMRDGLLDAYLAS